MITADMSASGRERISRGSSRLTLVSPLAGPTMLTDSQGEAQEVGAPIAHEDAGGIEVVAQEPQAGPCQGGGQQASSRLLRG
jgi:hypothetical protein